MTDSAALRSAIDESGLSITFISKHIGVSRECFYQKLSGKTEFRQSEIAKLTGLLRLSRSRRDAIFFAG